MAKAELTGIERQLVLDYLIDGNTPVTITPLRKETTPVIPATTKNVPKDASRIFPVALRAEQLTVLNQGVILLKNVPESVQSFDGEEVRVQFYFNKLGLYFITRLKRTKNALALVIPEAICRIQDCRPEPPSDINFLLYYEANAREAKGNRHIDCQISSSYPLLEMPKWSDVPEQNQQQAKAYLEKAVQQSKVSGTAIGNGLFLIPVCRFLSDSDNEVKQLAERSEPPVVLYMSHERIVFGCTKNSYNIQLGSEYALKLGFPLKNSPVKERCIYVSCVAEMRYENAENDRSCTVCRYTSLEKEDERFLYEKQQKREKK